MKKQMIVTSLKKTLCLIALITTSISLSQVGINTITPANGSILDIESREKGVFIPRMDIADLTTIAPVTGIVGAAEEAAAQGLLVYNTFAGTGTGFYFWNGTDWTALSAAAVIEPPIDSVTLANDVLISGSTFTNVSGMSVTFTARKTEALVNFTVSGLGFTGSLTFASFRLYNSTTASVIGGTNSSAQSLWKTMGSTFSITTWSAAFSKKITGLTIGTSYTIVVQGKTTNILGTDGVAIYPITNPDTSHATISILQ